MVYTKEAYDLSGRKNYSGVYGGVSAVYDVSYFCDVDRVEAEVICG